MKKIRVHYETLQYGHWVDSPNFYYLYETTNSEGITKQFLSPRKALQWEQS